MSKWDIPEIAEYLLSAIAVLIIVSYRLLKRIDRAIEGYIKKADSLESIDNSLKGLKESIEDRIDAL